ncbi:MAG: arsenic resistance N-acetyltransferase ArsN2 [Pseudomonadota bacterium]
MKIQPIAPADTAFNGVVSMLRDANLPTDDLGDETVTLFAYVHAGEICGAVGLQIVADNSALLRSLVVPPEFRGRGLGDVLAAFAERQSASQNLAELYLLTDTAERFFQRRGYDFVLRENAPEAIRNTEQFSALCPASAHLMRLVLHDRVKTPEETHHP